MSLDIRSFVSPDEAQKLFKVTLNALTLYIKVLELSTINICYFRIRRMLLKILFGFKKYHSSQKKEKLKLFSRL